MRLYDQDRRKPSARPPPPLRRLNVARSELPELPVLYTGYRGHRHVVLNLDSTSLTEISVA